MTTETIDSRGIPPGLRVVMRAVAAAGARLERIIRQGGHAAPALEEIAGAGFRDALAGSGLRWLALAGQEPQALDPDGDLALAIAPLDGLADLDANGPLGSLFAIFPAANGAEASFQRPARQMIAGGYMLYGPRCAMMVSFGDGVQHYALSPERRFELLESRVAIPDCSFEFAIDAANYRHWPRPVRAYIDDCLAGVDGPRQTQFTMRWTASLVAEAHRTLIRGGVFLYPADARKGHERGRLRLLHQCAPIAFLIEQAGGQASDACEPILDQRIAALDQPSPLVFGSAAKVARVAVYHDLPEPEISALFGHRGLFRA